MPRALPALSLLVLSTAAALVLSAQPGPGTESDSAEIERQEAIDELLALPTAERRVRLEALDREERRNLWFDLKRAERRARDSWTTPSSEGFVVDPGPERAALWNERAVGSITYDTGFPAVGFGDNGGGGKKTSNIRGNRFNTHTGIPVLASGTVSTVRAVVVPGPSNTANSAGFVLTGPKTSMGGANAILASQFATPTGVIDTVSFTGLSGQYTGSSFFVLFGDFETVYVPVFGTGTTLGQGHHAVIGLSAEPDIAATTPMPGLNGLIRVTGNIVPVELMTFAVD